MSSVLDNIIDKLSQLTIDNNGEEMEKSMDQLCYTLESLTIKCSDEEKKEYMQKISSIMNILFYKKRCYQSSKLTSVKFVY